MALEGAVDRLFGRRGARARAQGPAGRRCDDVVVRGRGGSRRSGDAPGRGEKGAFDPGPARGGESRPGGRALSLIHISEPTRRTPISYAVFCLKKKKKI